jgi:hypothetical protein
LVDADFLDILRKADPYSLCAAFHLRLFPFNAGARNLNIDPGGVSKGERLISEPCQGYINI